MKKSGGVVQHYLYSWALALLLWSLSSEMVNLTPLPFGSEIQGFAPSPMRKMLVTLGQCVSDAIFELHEMYQPCGKRPVKDILHVHDIETSNMSLTVCDGSNTTHVTTTSDNNDVIGIEFDETSDLEFY